MKKTLKKLSIILLTCFMLTNTACFQIPKLIIEGVMEGINQAEMEQSGNLLRYIPEEKPDLEDDYYAYMNFETNKEASISSGNSMWTVMSDISLDIAINLYRTTLELDKQQGTYEKGTPEQRVADFNTTISDYKTRDKESINRVNYYMNDVLNARTLDEYYEACGAFFQKYGFSSAIVFSIAPDAIDSNTNVAWMSRSDIVLEMEEFTDPDMESYRELYKKYIKDVLVAYGYSDAEATEKADGIYEMQKAIASDSLNAKDAGNPELYYNVCNLDDLKQLMPGVNVEKILSCFGMDKTNKWIASDKGAISKMSEYLREENLQLLKDYTVFIFLNDSNRYTNIEIRNLGIKYMIDFYGGSGFPQDEDIDIDTLQNTMKWDYGRIFCEKYFDEQSKRDVEDIVDELLAEYRNMIDSQEWMSVETREKAKLKLDTMTVKIGYPDKWTDNLDKADILSAQDGGILLDNFMKMQEAGMIGWLDRLDQEVDKTLWSAYPQDVNAYYMKSANEITFPAGIIQAPFYSATNTRAQNLGGIGMIIGHEITHAFDDEGSLYDENGNYNVWWSDEERAEFVKLQQEIEDYYDNFELIPGYYIDGKLTISENTADLGSLHCITNIIGDDEKSLREMYESYAKCWAQIDTKDFMINALKTDVHSHAKARVNAVLSSTDGFYKAYNIKPGDGMYVPEEKRVGIW